jgi:hypothetical protein
VRLSSCIAGSNAVNYDFMNLRLHCVASAVQFMLASDHAHILHKLWGRQ